MVADGVVVLVVADGVAVVVVAEWVAPLDAATVRVADLRAASAGSWPETSVIAIVSQVARNSATPLAIAARRILRTRAARACRIAAPERRLRFD